jgi:hypothetical protein
MRDVAQVSPPRMASDSPRSTGRCQTHAAPMPTSASPIMPARKPSRKGRQGLELFRSLEHGPESETAGVVHMQDTHGSTAHGG